MGNDEIKWKKRNDGPAPDAQFTAPQTPAEAAMPALHKFAVIVPKVDLTTGIVEVDEHGGHVVPRRAIVHVEAVGNGIENGILMFFVLQEMPNKQMMTQTIRAFAAGNWYDFETVSS